MIGSSANVMIVPHVAALENHSGFHCRRQGQARLDFVRLGRHRQRGAYQRREIPPRRRHRGHPCALSRRRRSDRRHPRRPGRFLFLPARDRAAPDPAPARSARCWSRRRQRVADLPDVPTPAEIGLKDADSAIWFGVFMPAKTPRDIVEKFHAAGRQGAGRSGDAGQPEAARRRADADDAGRDGRSRQARDGGQSRADQGRGIKQ